MASSPKQENVEAYEDSPSGYGVDNSVDEYGQPLVQFDRAAERRLRLKTDFMIVPIVALLYLFCFIDRANIGNARIAGMVDDLQLEGYDYNMIVSVFYISYIIFEIPVNLFCKYIGPGWFIPITTIIFGAISIATAYVETIPQIAGVRFLLGIFEAGMLPGIAYYLSRWYKRAELAFRLSLYMVMAPLAGAFGGLLASAILRLDGFAGVKSWRMIFAIEGVITVALGFVGLLLLTDRPETARWLTAEEKILAIARVKAERVGQTEVLDRMDKRKLWLGIICPITLSTAFVFLLNNITVQGLAFFLPTIVANIYPDAIRETQQLYTVPPYVVGAFFVILFPLLSWRFDRRQIFIILAAPMTMVGYAMFLGSEVNRVRYGATFLIASSAFTLGAMSNAQVSANVVSDTARSAGIGTNVMFGNIGGLIASWSFLPWDAPNYPIGNGLNLGASSGMLLVSTLTLLWMKRDNKKRATRDVEGELRGLSIQDIEDLDWKHPAFKWRP